jgi:phosphonoacetate hydrolase
MRLYGPERPGGQGLDINQYESGERAIRYMLAEYPGCDQADFVATFRDGAYEVWARRGMIRFKRMIDTDGLLHFEVIEQVGENPIANQDPYALVSIEDELEAAARSGFQTDDANRAFIEPQSASYPHAYERIAQVFDSPRGPDLIVSPKCFAYGVQAGQHGALDVVQSRAPLAFAGPGVRAGEHRMAPRQVDVAPTIARLMGFPCIDGRSSPSHAASNGRKAEVYLWRQDGRALDEIIDCGGAAPARVYLMIFDGLSNSELLYHLREQPDAIPNIAQIVGRAAFFPHGSIVNFPGITWPSHATILTGTWSGHHDLVNPTFYIRETRQTIPAQGNIFDTERYLGGEVETLYEAFKRVFGADTMTASIHEPQGRGADHAVFERRIVGDKNRLKALTAELIKDISPRWRADGMHSMEREEIVDARGIAQVMNLFDHCGDKPPVFVAHEFVLTDGAGHDYGPHHEGLREAIRRTDARVGTVLRMLEDRGLLESTLFVLTSDHGMAAQRVELKANPAREPERFGVKGIFAEPMIYLRDMAVECARSRDLRNLRVTVADNDPGPDGSCQPLAEAVVTVDDADGNRIAATKTSGDGVAVVATPASLKDAELHLRIEHPDFNPRSIRADGSLLLADLRSLLYPDVPRS